MRFDARKLLIGSILTVLCQTHMFQSSIVQQTSKPPGFGPLQMMNKQAYGCVSVIAEHKPSYFLELDVAKPNGFK